MYRNIDNILNSFYTFCNYFFFRKRLFLLLLFILLYNFYKKKKYNNRIHFLILKLNISFVKINNLKTRLYRKPISIPQKKFFLKTYFNSMISPSKNSILYISLNLSKNVFL